ncbi:hypothetical protein NCC49_004441 [Naganishia albida]|nr:hypothetical protein NCC49_004441 [Naganishia albida]
MPICASPRTNHRTHLALLGTLLFFECVSMAISAAFIARGKSLYYGYYFKSSALVLAANVATIIATATLLLFNLVGNLYKGLKNTMMVELIVFEILWILNLAGSSYMSSDADGFGCSSKSCQLAKATLAFSWIANFTIACLQAFLWVWTCVHRKRQAEKSVYKSSIKGRYVERDTAEREGETAMAHINPAAPPITSSALDRPETPVESARPSQARSI